MKEAGWGVDAHMANIPLDHSAAVEYLPAIGSIRAVAGR